MSDGLPPEAPQLRMWTIYHGAADIVSPYCTREWVVTRNGQAPAGPPAPAHSLAEAQELVPPGLHRIPRSPSDDPVIVETWL